MPVPTLSAPSAGHPSSRASTSAKPDHRLQREPLEKGSGGATITGKISPANETLASSDRGLLAFVSRLCPVRELGGDGRTPLLPSFYPLFPYARGQQRTDDLQEVDRRARHGARCLHGGPRHPDHQLLARPDLRGRRSHLGRGGLDFNRLPDRRDHHHRADCLVRQGLHGALLPAGQHHPVPDLLVPVRHLSQLGRDDRLPCRPGLYRRGAHPHVADDHRLDHAQEPARRRSGHVRDHGHPGTGRGSLPRRLAHRQLRLGMELLHQPLPGCGHAGGFQRLLFLSWAGAWWSRPSWSGSAKNPSQGLALPLADARRSFTRKAGFPELGGARRFSATTVQTYRASARSISTASFCTSAPSSLACPAASPYVQPGWTNRLARDNRGVADCGR